MSKKTVDYSNFSSLKFLTSGFGTLKNVAEFFEKNLVNLTGRNKIFDLLLVKPLRSESVLFDPKIPELKNDDLVILKLKVQSHIEPKTRRQPHKIICYSPSGFVNLVFFKIYPSQLSKLAVGCEIAVLGNFNQTSGESQIVHPQEIVDIKDTEKLPVTNLVYPLSGALTQKFVRAKINEILNFLVKKYDDQKAKNNDWIERSQLQEKAWPLFVPALMALHNYNFEFTEGQKKSAQERLKYDELLSWQLAMRLVKSKEMKSKEKPDIDHKYADAFLQSLPFEATNAQKKAIEDLKKDVISDKRMLRLLQGDVGSGKTIVAIYATLLSFLAGKQSCIIVPISILADQHFAYFKKLIEEFCAGDLGKEFLQNCSGEKRVPKIEILTSKTTKKKKEAMVAKLKAGEIDVLISTHAVLQGDVQFKDLGLAVIDEQHRFGVMQRLNLVEKGKDVDVLLMSATPIPRSLMMAVYGDTDISILDEKPKNRQEIDTVIVAQSKVEGVFDGVKRAMERGEKVYWICPLIEESEEVEVVVAPVKTLAKEVQEEKCLMAAKTRFDELSKVFGAEKVALLHGKMKNKEKDLVMKKFKESLLRHARPKTEESRGSDFEPVSSKSEKNALQILVATTVIEVGIDVPDATVMVIENAENFGLSQLHQLRGRVGRSDKKSYCILLYGKKYGKIAQQRLAIMRNSNDGFYIAEEDMKLRGSGEMLGVRQSGVAELRMADLTSDVELLKMASFSAVKILQNDPGLLDDKSAKYRALLQLFSYGDCLRLTESG